MLKKISSIFLLTLCFVGTSHAALLNFDLTYDGISESLGATSDPMGGTTVNVGDSINLSVHAAGHDYWSVGVNSQWIIEAALGLLSDGIRTVDSSIGFYLDGTLQHFESVVGESQMYAHLGGPNVVNVFAGLIFDEVVVDVNLISSTADTTIANGGLHFNWFSDTNVTYNEGVIAVPEPSTVVLLVFGLLGLGFRRKLP